MEVPDDQLNEVEIQEKKRQKNKADAKKGFFLFCFVLKTHTHTEYHLTARDQKLDPQFVESLILQRNAILERKLQRQKAKDKARGGRKSSAAQERLQTLATQAFEEPTAKRARKVIIWRTLCFFFLLLMFPFFFSLQAAGKKLGETEDDNFGADDADWDVYGREETKTIPSILLLILFYFYFLDTSRLQKRRIMKMKLMTVRCGILICCSLIRFSSFLFPQSSCIALKSNCKSLRLNNWNQLQRTSSDHAQEKVEIHCIMHASFLTRSSFSRRACSMASSSFGHRAHSCA